MNQGKLEVVKQEMARVKVDILAISKLKWTGMGEFHSHDQISHSSLFLSLSLSLYIYIYMYVCVLGNLYLFAGRIRFIQFCSAFSYVVFV